MFLSSWIPPRMIFSIERDPSVDLYLSYVSREGEEDFSKGKIEAFSPEKRWRMQGSGDKSDDARPITGLPFTRRVASRPIRYETRKRSSFLDLARFNDIVTSFLPRTRNFDRVLPFRYTSRVTYTGWIARPESRFTGIANDRLTRLSNWREISGKVIWRKLAVLAATGGTEIESWILIASRAFKHGYAPCIIYPRRFLAMTVSLKLTPIDLPSFIIASPNKIRCPFPPPCSGLLAIPCSEPLHFYFTGIVLEGCCKAARRLFAKGAGGEFPV